MYRRFRKMTSYKRVLVHLQSKADTQPKQAHFTQSVLDVFGCKGDISEVYAETRDGDKLLIKQEATKEGDKPIKIKRPSFCPIHHMTEAQKKQLPQVIYDRGVDVGAATILESCDGRVLLIRRAAHLRTFPGIWVPPGGHAEENESLYDAALRELKEESGLDIKHEHCDKSISQNPVIAFWESAYPPKLSVGLPKRHHIVTYVHAKLLPPFTAEEMEKKLKLDPEEVGAAAWFSREMVQAVTKASDEDQTSGQPKQNDFSAVLVDRSAVQSTGVVSGDILTAVHTGGAEDSERVSTGTKFALAEWLKRTSAT